MKETILYFIPHQDDELLTMGVSIIKDMKEHDVHVVLCTDGSKSNIRKVLNNKRFCTRHFGMHRYNLSEEEFSKSRDKEFIQSCTSLGLKKENIHIDESRTIDGNLTIDSAKDIMKKYINKYENVKVKTMSHLGGDSVHKDHKNLGFAAEKLYEEGKINDLELLIDPYYYEEFKSVNPSIEVNTLTVDSKEDEEKIVNAISSYKYWKPKEGRYCIGYHSTKAFFDGLIKEKKSYIHIYK